MPTHQELPLGHLVSEEVALYHTLSEKDVWYPRKVESFPASIFQETFLQCL